MEIDAADLTQLVNNPVYSQPLQSLEAYNAETYREGMDSHEELDEAHGPEGVVAAKADTIGDAMPMVAEVDTAPEAVEAMDLEAAAAAGPSTCQGIMIEPKGSTPAAAAAGPTGAPCLFCLI